MYPRHSLQIFYTPLPLPLPQVQYHKPVSKHIRFVILNLKLCSQNRAIEQFMRKQEVTELGSCSAHPLDAMTRIKILRIHSRCILTIKTESHII